MKNILAITNDRSKALQRKYQNIVNALRLVKISKARLHKMRDGGCDSLLNEVESFCMKYSILISNME